jgi:hypothetical protein
MKKVLALSLATCLLAGGAVAQTQTPNRPSPPNATVAPPNAVTDQNHNPGHVFRAVITTFGRVMPMNREEIA